jgi:hypothetical protein
MSSEEFPYYKCMTVTVVSERHSKLRPTSFRKSYGTRSNVGCSSEQQMRLQKTCVNWNSAQKLNRNPLSAVNCKELSKYKHLAKNVSDRPSEQNW